MVDWELRHWNKRCQASSDEGDTLSEHQQWKRDEKIKTAARLWWIYGCCMTRIYPLPFWGGEQLWTKIFVVAWVSPVGPAPLCEFWLVLLIFHCYRLRCTHTYTVAQISVHFLSKLLDLIHKKSNSQKEGMLPTLRNTNVTKQTSLLASLSSHILYPCLNSHVTKANGCPIIQLRTCSLAEVVSQYMRWNGREYDEANPSLRGDVIYNVYVGLFLHAPIIQNPPWHRSFKSPETVHTHRENTAHLIWITATVCSLRMSVEESKGKGPTTGMKKKITLHTNVILYTTTVCTVQVCFHKFEGWQSISSYLSLCCLSFIVEKLWVSDWCTQRVVRVKYVCYCFPVLEALFNQHLMWTRAFYRWLMVEQTDSLYLHRTEHTRPQHRSLLSSLSLPLSRPLLSPALSFSLSYSLALVLSLSVWHMHTFFILPSQLFP